MFKLASYPDVNVPNAIEWYADALIRSCLRGEKPPWPKEADSRLVNSVLARCAFHGVSGLVYERFAEDPAFGRNIWPRDLAEELRERAATKAIWDAQHQRILFDLLEKLSASGLDPLVLKGTALAYTLYPHAPLRERGDTDLLIGAFDKNEADKVLTSFGFERVNAVTGAFVSYQDSYRISDRLGLNHLIDLHWRVSNVQILANLFCHDELRERSVAVPALGISARATGLVDSVLIACMHRKVHLTVPFWVDGTAHFSPDRLIWLYDLHLLAKALDRRERAGLVKLANEKGLAAVCRDGFLRTAELLGAALPRDLAAALDPDEAKEQPSVYFRSSSARQKFMNLRAIPGISRKLRFMREAAFPPSSYMLARYVNVRPSWLPWLYLRRLVRGVVSRFWIGVRRSNRTDRRGG